MQAEPTASRALAAAARAGAIAGAALAALDVAVTVTRAPPERLLARAASQAAGVVLVVSLVALLASAAWSLALRAPRALRPAMATLAGALAGGVGGVALFSGTGVRRLGMQLPLTAAAVVAGAVIAWISLRRNVIARITDPARRPFAAALAAALYAIHATVLVRQYPLAHALLALGAAAAAIVAAWRATASGAWALVPMLGVAALRPLAGAQSIRSALRTYAPLGQYPARLAGVFAPRVVAAGPSDDRGARAHGPHIPLQDKDIVLVTVDALRADVLRANGGRGRMPRLDAMAARGVNFRNAYCSTPHTSYSLASLMLGAHARAVLALPGDGRPRTTLAQRLAARGYATAAFYPPAVFAVDRERFGALASGRFGFAYAEERYADAPEVVRAATAWLRARPRRERVFLWVHLFEPHEPYAAHPGHDFGRDARSRYESECAAADASIGALRDAVTALRGEVAWVVSADHGEEFGEHGGSFHGTSVYGEQTRVPLVLVVPGLSPRVVDAPVSLVDVTPTILGGVGSPRPPRVMGDDLGPLLYGLAWQRPVFSETGSLRRVTLGREALITDLDDGALELYNLDRDPRERANLADARPERAAALRAEIARWEVANARVDAEGVTTAPAMPEVLTRAMQGDRALAPEVARVAADAQKPESTRVHALRVLGDLGARDASVRDVIAPLGLGRGALAAEAGVTLALLGDPRGVEGARRVLAGGDLDARRRAALGLARVGDAAGIEVLGEMVNDARAGDAARDAAVEGLRALRDARAIPVWERLLGDMRLAPRAADALGELGDPRAIPILERSLPTQRYPLTIRAVLGALAALHAPGVLARVDEAMGRGDPLPELFPLLRALDEPGITIVGRRRVSRLRAGRTRAFKLIRTGVEGPWRAVRRVYLRVEAAEDGSVTVDDADARPVHRGENTFAVDLPAPLRGRRLRVGATTDLRVLGLAAR